MNRRGTLRLAGLALVGAAAPKSFADTTHMEDQTMPLEPRDIQKLADAYTVAWNTGSPEGVAGYFAEDGEIVINGGTPWRRRSGVAEMAAGFFADVPDMKLTCDGIRCAGSHVVYLWTFTGHDAKTMNALTVRGWEEWDLGDDLKVKSSRGWYDAADYARQAAGGAA